MKNCHRFIAAIRENRWVSTLQRKIPEMEDENGGPVLRNGGSTSEIMVQIHMDSNTENAQPGPANP